MASAGATAAAPSRVAFGWDSLPVWMRRAILLGLLILVWYAYIWVAHPKSLLFASPWETAKTFWNGWSDGSLAGPTWRTLKLLLEGTGIGLGVGLVLTAFATLTKVGEDL
ncbi:MAG TPA: hypothetical protein VIU16_01625, partial [Gaiellaceae bacterium]